MNQQVGGDNCMPKFSIAPKPLFRRVKENFSIAHFLPALFFHFLIWVFSSPSGTPWSLLLLFSSAALLWLAGILLCLGIKRAVWIHVGILLFFFLWALGDSFSMIIVLYFLCIPISMCAVWNLTRIIRAEEKAQKLTDPGR